jgi:hypothetical protein
VEDSTLPSYDDLHQALAAQGAALSEIREEYLGQMFEDYPYDGDFYVVDKETFHNMEFVDDRFKLIKGIGK